MPSGEVVGILEAFKRISEQSANGLTALAGGIAEALVTTAIGFLVAIPAVMMFNYLAMGGFANYLCAWSVG